MNDGGRDPFAEITREELLIFIKNETLEKLLRNKVDLSFFQKMSLKEPNQKDFTEGVIKRQKLVEQHEVMLRAIDEELAEVRKK